MSGEVTKSVGNEEEKNPLSEMAAAKEERTASVLSPAGEATDEGPNILYSESFYENDHEDEYWTQAPTGRKLHFADQQSDGVAKRDLVEREVVIEAVYYSRHNVELDMKSALCCCISS